MMNLGDKHDLFHDLVMYHIDLKTRRDELKKELKMIERDIEEVRGIANEVIKEHRWTEGKPSWKR